MNYGMGAEMPKRFKKSELPSNFEAVVESYRQAMIMHQFSENVPAPSVDPMIADCIRRVQMPGNPDYFEPDYEIIDDTPPPPTLDQKKQKLVESLRAAEAIEHNMLNPVSPGKRRLVFHMLADASAKPPEERTQAEHQLIGEHAAANQAMAAVSKRAAEAEAAIDDLTEQTVDKYVLPSLR